MEYQLPLRLEKFVNLENFCKISSKGNTSVVLQQRVSAFTSESRDDDTMFKALRDLLKLTDLI